ncbi:MAG TPA: hypothetical protein VM733_18750 [Thermoanaerobaculia bacterium]|nr:hypothetical protein [Thermoanaerobaculia bacterium]
MAKLRGSLFVLALLVPVMAWAQSSNGDFSFALSGATGAIQFDARVHGSNAKGNITFTATQDISGESVDDGGGPGAAAATANITVSIDCLKQNGNRASMSGLVTASNVPGYVGARAILAVEDNGEGVNAARDAFTWGVYRENAATWFPTDSEVPGDNGASFSWTATDFEDPSDPGIPAGANAPKGTTCKSFGLGAYALNELGHGSGNIQVRP